MIKYTVITVICIALLMAGCASPTQEPAQVVNPMVEKQSLEEINVAAGTNIQRPVEFEITGEKYFVINTETPVADYRFTVDNIDYTLRAAKVLDSDISGVYGDIGTITTWINDNVQYSLFSQAEDDDYTLRRIAAEQARDIYPVVESIGDGWMTVIPNEGTIERKAADRIQVKIEHVDPSREPVPGDVVQIIYNGMMLETYPAQLAEVYSIRVMLPVG